LFIFLIVLAEVLTSAFLCIIFAPDFQKIPSSRPVDQKTSRLKLYRYMKDKLTIQLLTAAILSIGGLIMLYCGVFIDPQGQVHESLLVAFGEVATFSGALMGIDYVYKKKN